MTRQLPALALAPAPAPPRRHPHRRGTPPRALRAGAAREGLTAERVWELRRRMARGEFDTPAHAQALAWALLERGVTRA